MNQRIDLEKTMHSSETRPRLQTRTSLVLRYGLPLLIVLCGSILAWYLMSSSPRAERTVKARVARLVETTTASRRDMPVNITAWGEVKPAQNVTLTAQVSGVVVALNHALEPGSFVNAGESLLQFDAADYQTAVTQRQSELAQAQANQDIERGNQSVARSEYDLLGTQATGTDKNLMLRAPQLQVANAQVDSARAAVDAAKLDLARTQVRAPFDAVIRERVADLGSYIAVNGQLMALAGTRQAWVEISVPLDQLQWIRFPVSDADAGLVEEGSAVKLFYDKVWPANQYRTGKVIRLLSDLESTGRMARVLVQVNDPFAREKANQGQPRMLLGSFVRAEIEGASLQDVVVIPATLLHENDSVWVFRDGQLEVRPVEVVYRDQDTVYIRSGVTTGEQLVTSSMTTATAGMALRVNGDDSRE